MSCPSRCWGARNCWRWPPEGPPELLGDIALAFETCAREADDKGVPLTPRRAPDRPRPADLAGHDHETSPEDAAAMEALEIKALAPMGIADPYAMQNRLRGF